jgi:ribosomal protein S12 methylthiotransferase accessory factor
LEIFVSADVGIVNRVDEACSSFRHPRLAMCFTRGCDSSAVGAAPPRGGTGGVGTSVGAARAAAIGEVLERYCAAHRPEPLRVATTAELRGERAGVQPSNVIPPAVPADPDASIAWARGTRLDSSGAHRPAWIAAARVYMDADDAERQVTTSTGLAFHYDPWRAARGGLLECIERDAVMVSWLTRSGARELSTELRWRSDGVEIRFDLALERYRLYELDSPIGVPVVFALALGSDGQPPVAVGAAAHPDVVRAARKALIEAYQTFWWVRQMQADGRAAPSANDIGDLDDHVAYYLDSARLAAFDHLINAPTVPGPDLDKPRCDLDPESDVLRIVADADRGGHAVYLVEVTTPDVRAAGGRVIRAVTPTLHPLLVGTGLRDHGPYSDAHPRLRGRIYEPNPHPHPFP